MINKAINEYYLHAVFFISFLASLGTLFYSEVEGLTPCDLCWYQRALMYPIAIVSFIAIVTGDKRVGKYIIGLAVPGIFIAFYNYLLQKTDWFVSLGTCSPDNPCSQIDVEYFGFITIPFLSFIAFWVITLVTSYYMYLQLKKKS